MITTICMNPSFDKTVEVDSMTVGEMNRIRSARVDMGGKGINVAVVARRLGMDVRCVGCMGADGAQRLTAMMDAEGLQHRFLTVEGSIRTNLKAVSLDGKGVTELNELGAPLSKHALEEFLALACKETKDSDYVVVTGSLPPECPAGTYRMLMEALGDRRCILDATGQELLLGLAAKPFLVKPNLSELSATLGTELRTLRAIRDAALILLNKGAQNAVVSMGSMGAMLVGKEHTLYAPAVKVSPRSTVGAGDAMVGGMLLGLQRENSLMSAFRYGIAAGAASVMTEGTQLLRTEDFNNLLSQVKIQEV